MDTPAAFLFSGGFACHGDLMRILRALRSHATLSVTAGVLTVVLVLGGIPWNVYFQRILAIIYY